MIELKEIRVSDNRLTLHENRVKSSIIPQVAKELDRTIVVQGDVEVEGPVYAHTILVQNGPADFQGAVYAQSEIHVESNAKGEITFHKAVGCSQSVVSLSPGAVVEFGADINAKTVRLRNAYVAASIFAEDIYLENCVVLGGVFATKKADLKNVMVGTFNSPAVNVSGINYLLYPSAFSVEPIAVLPGTEFYNLTLADLGALYKGAPEKPETGKIPLDLKIDSLRTVLMDDNKNSILVNSYSVAGKILISDSFDLDKLENHFLLTAGTLGSQLLKSYSFPDSDAPELTMRNLREFFFKILNGQVAVADLNGSISFSKMKGSYKV